MAKRLLAPKPEKEAVKKLRSIVRSLAHYDLVDVMVALADELGGTTPLYEAVEEATVEIDNE